jgi:hypothetical protein
MRLKTIKPEKSINANKVTTSAPTTKLALASDVRISVKDRVNIKGIHVIVTNISAVKSELTLSQRI